jgi:pilus assembly protein CpaB
MRKSLLPLLGIAFAVAILATLVFYGLFLSKFQSGSAANAGPPMVVAARDLERGTALKPTDVKLVNWGGAPVKGALSSPQQVAGLSLMGAVQENEPLTQARVASLKSGGGMGIAAGMRAVSVHVVDSSGVVAMLRPGHQVDVQVVAAPNSRQQEEVRIQTMLQRMEVLAVSTQLESSTGRFPGQVITLLATPAEADLLGLADSLARIRVTLRNPMDEQRQKLPSVGLPALFRPGSTASAPPLLRAGAARTLDPLTRGARTCPPAPPSCR